MVVIQPYNASTYNEISSSITHSFHFVMISCMLFSGKVCINLQSGNVAAVTTNNKIGQVFSLMKRPDCMYTFLLHYMFSVK